MMHHDFESGVAIAVDDPSQVGEVRRTANALASSIGLSSTDAGHFAILASEAATNISKHAGRGEIMMRSIDTPQGPRGAELVAIDSGPGIGDIDRAFSDGYSTTGSSGTGLGAMSRLATTFDIYTTPGSGTVLAARITPGRRTPMAVRADFQIGVVRVAKRGEVACGDDWRLVMNQNGRAMLAVADGLGHGQAAADASRRAVEIAGERSSEQPAMIITHVHAALRSTRGAAVAVAEVRADHRSVRYAGLGNIAGTIVSPRESKSLVSHNGIAGHEMRKVQEFSYDWASDALLVLHSDGLSSRWDLGKYPGLTTRDPSVIAGVLYRDFSRGRDDSLVVVIRAAA